MSYYRQQRSFNTKCVKILVLSVTLDGTNFNSSEETLPVFTNQSIAIKVYDVYFEHNVDIEGDAKYCYAFLSQKSETAEKFIDDSDLVCKYKITNELTTSGMVEHDHIHHLHFAPPIGIAPAKIYLHAQTDLGSAVIMKARIHYQLDYILDRHLSM